MAKISVLIDVDEEKLKSVSGDNSLEDAITRELDWLRDSGMKVESWEMVETEHNKQSEKVELDLGFTKLVAKKGIDSESESPEIDVYLVNKDGLISQDLAVIGGNYHVENGKTVYDDNIRIRVYDNEYYAHDFAVDVWEMENRSVSLDKKVEQAKETAKKSFGKTKEQER